MIGGDSIGGLVTGFSLSVICIFCPCLLAFVVFPNLRRSAYFVTGVLAAVSLICLCIVSALGHQLLAPGGAASLACIAFSSLFVLGFAWVWRAELETSGAPGVRSESLAPVALLAGVAVLDCFLVFSAQSWGIDGRVPYFHSPLQLDPRRTADLVAALARGADSLFLPGSTLVYQVFWHHGAATLLTLLPVKLSVYHQVAGIGLATAFLMYALLFWAMKLIRPNMRWLSWAVLLVLVLAVVEGQIGAYIEAWVVDGYKSLGWVSFQLRNSQYFSLKLIALTAPQHAMFIALFIGYIGVRWNSNDAVCRVGSIAWVLCVSAVVASPILAAILLPFYFLAETCFAHRSKGVLRQSIFLWLGIAAAALSAHWLILGFPMWDLFLRGEASSISYVWRRGFPFIDISVLAAGFLGSNGALGIAFSVAAIPAIALASRESVTGSRQMSRVGTCCAALLGGFLFWNFVIIDTEIRRHSAIAACALMLLVTFYALSSTLLVGQWRRALFCIAAGAAVLGAVIHLYMIRGYSGHNASSVSFNTPWGDYLEANQYLREYRPAAAVIAASGEGMVLPVVNEAAISLAPKLAVFAHQKVDSVRRDFLAPAAGLSSVSAAELTPEWRRKAIDIGFDTVIWGPIEEEVWGVVGRAVLLKGATFLASRGRVGIFSLPSKVSSSEADPKNEFSGNEFLAFSVCERSSTSLIGGAGYHLEWFDGRYRVIEPSTMNLVMDGPVLHQLWYKLKGEHCDAMVRLPTTLKMAYPKSKEGTALGRAPVAIPKLESSSSIEPARLKDGLVRTNVEDYPWVVADLGKTSQLYGLRFIAGPPRSTGLPMRHLIVSVSEAPFPPGFDPLGYSPTVKAFHVPELLSGENRILFNSFGRFIRLTVPGNSAITIEGMEVSK